MKKSELTKEKIHNMKVFLQSLNNEEIARLIPQFEEYETDYTKLLYGIKTIVLPYFPNKLEEALNKFAEVYKFDINKLEMKDKVKIKRYLEFFCKIIKE